jgi:hypothetical protein
MAEMSTRDFEELIGMLDGRIDELTKPLPSRQILRFAEAIRSAKLSTFSTQGSYGPADYSNLVQADSVLHTHLPAVLENIRAHSIARDQWQHVFVDREEGVHGLCAICDSPFHHFAATVQMHHFDLAENSFCSVCRDCVRSYAPLEFVNRDEVREWLQANPTISRDYDGGEADQELQIELIDAIRRQAHLSNRFSELMNAPVRLLNMTFTEWR